MKSILIWWRIDIRISYNWTYTRTEPKKCNLMDSICKTQPKPMIKCSWGILPVIIRILCLHKSKPLAKGLTHDLFWTLETFTFLLSYAYWFYRALTWTLAGANCRNLWKCSALRKREWLYKLYFSNFIPVFLVPIIPYSLVRDFETILIVKFT